MNKKKCLIDFFKKRYKNHLDIVIYDYHKNNYKVGDISYNDCPFHDNKLKKYIFISPFNN